MEEMLKEALRSDEKLLWSGRPERFETLDKTHKSSFYRKIVWSVAICAAVLALYIIMALKNGADIKPVVIIVVVACGVLGPMSFFSDASKLRKNVLYAVTDKRLILVREGVRDMDFSRIKSASLRRDADGHTSLLCGERALKAKPDKWRAASLLAQGSGDGEDELCENFAFYALPESPELDTILFQHLPIIA